MPPKAAGPNKICFWRICGSWPGHPRPPKNHLAKKALRDPCGGFSLGFSMVLISFSKVVHRVLIITTGLQKTTWPKQTLRDPFEVLELLDGPSRGVNYSRGDNAGFGRYLRLTALAIAARGGGLPPGRALPRVMQSRRGAFQVSLALALRRGWLLEGMLYAKLAFCLGHLEGGQPVPHPSFENQRFPGVLFDDIWGIRGRLSRPIWGIPGVRPEFINHV